MTNIQWLLVLVCLFGVSKSTKLTSCGPPLDDKCNCAKQPYDSVFAYVVNCTNSGFSNPDVLKHLPKETEVILSFFSPVKHDIINE